MQRNRLPMFALKSRYLRRRLSAPTSGSAKRRALERQRAQQTQAEGLLLAKTKREQRYREKIEQQRQAREELASYEPWGRGGGGAPNPKGIRYTDLRAGEIYADDEVKGGCPFKARQRYSSPRRRRRKPLRLREDPQLFFADGLRKAVDNDIRYRKTPEEQKSYKDILDDMVDTKKQALKHELKQNRECERRLQALEGPWSKPGPGGTIWRNPGNIGFNFSKSMGWTNNEMFDKIKVDHDRHKRSSLTLPKVKNDDDSPVKDKENIKPSSVEKLPDINIKPHSDEEKVEVKKDSNKNCNKKNVKKEKFVKRLSNGESVKRILPELEQIVPAQNEIVIVRENKLTPETTILRLTGGIELVPLLARRRRVGPRTLPSSDVTRAPEENCQWRELLNNDYLRELKSQMQFKYEKKEECRRDSAESSLRHHDTWASMWGRPGHGAPQRGRYARNNLAQLLYVAP